MTVRARWLLAGASLVVGLAAVFVLTQFAAAPQSARIETYQRTGDPKKIIANVVVGLDAQIVGTSTVEDAKTVRVTVSTRPLSGNLFGPPVFRPLVGIFLPVVVQLRDPLGDRAVLDQSGRPVQDAGIWQIPREPPVDLAEVGQIEKGSFRTSGDAIDFRWKEFTGRTRSLADFRGSTGVILSRHRSRANRR
jgi:hypothetical protein